MKTIHLLQGTALVGAGLFYLAGYLFARWRHRLRPTTSSGPATRESQDRDLAQARAQAEKMTAVATRLQEELREAKDDLSEARGKASALHEVVRRGEQTRGAAPRGTQRKAEAESRPDEIRQMHEAIEELESELAESRSRAKEAEGRVRALNEALKQHLQQGAPRPDRGDGPRQRKAREADDEQVGRLQQAVEMLEDELRDCRSAHADAREKNLALEEMLRQRKG